MSEFVVPSISVSRDIPTSAAVIFAVLANPAMHARIDGTGMAQRADDETVITKVGDVFIIHMTHWSLGDYGMENRVVEFVPNRRIVWEPFAHTYQSAKFDEMLRGVSARETRYWGWELEPLGPTLTRVTEFYDCSRLSDGLRSFLEDGEFWRLGMRKSLENLERLVLAPTTTENVATDEPTTPRNYYQEVKQSG
jgi:hypothetical protein